MRVKIRLSIGSPEVIGLSKSPTDYPVAKKINLQKQNGSSSSGDTPNTDVSQPETSKTKSPKSKAPAKRKTTTVSRKTSSTKAARKSGAPPEPSADEIRHRAYFIAERRAQLSLPADATADWLEAKRQLFAEAGLPVP